jgi:hypothetical protein
MQKAKVKVFYGSLLDENGGLRLGIGRPDRRLLVDIEQILEDVVYRDWEWCLMVSGDMAQLSSLFTVEDAATRQPIRLVFYGNSIPLDRAMYHDMPVERMVVDTAWRAVKDFALHEAAEWFRYKGVMIHDPHKEERDRAAKMLEKKIAQEGLAL